MILYMGIYQLACHQSKIFCLPVNFFFKWQPFKKSVFINFFVLVYFVQVGPWQVYIENIFFSVVHFVSLKKFLSEYGK